MKAGRKPKLGTPLGVYKTATGRDAEIATYAQRHSTEAAAQRFGIGKRRVQQISATHREVLKRFKSQTERINQWAQLQSGYAQVYGRLLQLTPQLGLREADVEKMPRRAALAMLKLHRRCVDAEARAGKMEVELKRRRTQDAANSVAPSLRQRAH